MSWYRPVHDWVKVLATKYPNFQQFGYERWLPTESTVMMKDGWKKRSLLIYADISDRGMNLRNLQRVLVKTNIRCHPVGEFDCFQVVSMRPIPRHLVEKAFQVTHPMSDVHGAPMHIGNPGAIGIADISNADSGDFAHFHPEDVAVFWPCGVTGCKAVLSARLIKEEIPVLQYPPADSSPGLESAKQFLTHSDGVTVKFDHLIAIERSGQGSDGIHRTMHGRDISHLIDSSDYLFEAAAELLLVFTIGIGDGGNEIGMGKVYNKVVATVPNGSVIACKTSTDYLIASGLCDWGGMALSMALYLLRLCPIHDRYQRRAIGFPPTKDDKAQFRDALLSVDKARKLLECLLEHDFRDGITGCGGMTVDTLPFEGVIDDKIKQMLPY